MTVKEYLNQAHRLEQKMKVLVDEIVENRALLSSISSPGFEEHYNATKNTDAPFVRALEKIIERENELSEKTILLMDLKKEISATIETVPNDDYRLILIYRYIQNLSWCKIADNMNLDESTVRRWHNKALAQVKIPA